MKQVQMKSYSLTTGALSAFAFMAILFFAAPLSAQNAAKFEIFHDSLPAGTVLQNGDKIVRNGGYTKGSAKYLYLHRTTSPSALTGLSLKIRKNPGAGEYRYITFAWIKWGGGQIGMQFDAESPKQPGNKYNYTYAAGEGKEITPSLLVSDRTSGSWTAVTRDLWKDFGDFTLTGITFICTDGRDAGFDGIYLGKNLAAFDGAPQIIPTEVAAPTDVDGDLTLSNDFYTTTTDDDEGDAVSIDWASQIAAGGAWMYPIYLLGIAAIIIALQRVLISRFGRLAPKKLRIAVRDALSKKDISAALAACDKYPSTLANALRFIFQHRRASIEVVSQNSGDIAARDIRAHVAGIYPLSIIASVAPLLGLLGTIVGMIEAFGLVALYGDEGGAAILSDSISKALITTMAGLIVAAPSIVIYFIIKNRVMSISSKIEVEIENTINELYLNEDEDDTEKSNQKEGSHAPVD